MTASPSISAEKRGIRLSASRRGLHVLAPALLLLGVCVFAWGLRYKLSFYSQPHSFKQKMAEAKLLLTDRSALPAVALGKSSVHAAPLAVSLWAPALLLVAGVTFPFGREWALDHAQVHALPGAFRNAPPFIRPPPRG